MYMAASSLSHTQRKINYYINWNGHSLPNLYIIPVASCSLWQLPWFFYRTYITAFHSNAKVFHCSYPSSQSSFLLCVNDVSLSISYTLALSILFSPIFFSLSPNELFFSVSTNGQSHLKSLFSVLVRVEKPHSLMSCTLTTIGRIISLLEGLDYVS